MTKYKNIRYKEKLQWAFNLEWQKKTQSNHCYS